jgi:hypothetical protein
MVPALLLLLALVSAHTARGQQATSAADSITGLLAAIERGVLAGDSGAVVRLAAPGDQPGLDDFLADLRPPPARFTIKERDRTSGDAGHRLLVEVFSERGNEARIGTWRMDVRADAAGAEPRIVALERLALVSGLYRLSLNSQRQFDIRNLKITAPDLELEMTSGHAFVAETPEGPTAVVLVGRGRMRFAPADAAERTQLRIFARSDDLVSDFDGAFLRIRPSEFDSRFPASALVARDVSASDLRRAQQLFDEFSDRTLHLDLSDLSRDRWSLVPASGDLIAEVRTRRHGTLTYARASKDAEDVSLFDRRRRKNIAVYASQEKLASRGRFYSEDDLVEYDVLRYDIDAAFAPDRHWIDGNARVKIKVRSAVLGSMTLRLADSLTVRSVSSPEFGHLLHLRVVNQNSVIVNFASPLLRGSELWLHVLYSGRLDPQTIEREAIAAGDAQDQLEPIQIQLEPQFVYSNRSYWHPQGTVTDYATARLRLVVPDDYDVVASGAPAGPPAPAPGVVAEGERPRKMFVFDCERPVRYLAAVISRFNPVTTAQMNVPSDPTAADDGDGDDGVALYVQANPRQMGRARSLTQKSAEIFEYYASLVGQAPYPSFTLAVTESELPGGHSPAYFALLNQTLPMAPFVWRNDPVSFEGYPSFFLAHELAHQWWGQGIGWKNYHEQWLSEGFSQYFAALFAAKERGHEQFETVLRQMRKWAMEQSPQGPVYLGYRLGHIKSDGRVFRALVYNKGAMVLHMLRRLMGDEAFFAGVRRFYADWRFKKAGTDDFRAAMEAAGGRDLNAFFDAWIYGAEVPELKFTERVLASGEARIRFEHQGLVMPVPVTVTITYASGESEDVIVPVIDRVVERTLPLKGRVRSIAANRDHAALAEIDQ